MVTYEDNGSDSIHYSYDANGNLVSMNYNGTEYFYVRNAQGDIIGLIDKKGALVASYVYDTWGKLISIKDASGNDVTNDATNIGYKNPYRYRGYRYDTETGLYYLQSRYYNPEWGRFINADDVNVIELLINIAISDPQNNSSSLLLMPNLFAYAVNNPVNNSDLNGLWVPEWIKNVCKNTVMSVADEFKENKVGIIGGLLAGGIGGAIKGVGKIKELSKNLMFTKIGLVEKVKTIAADAFKGAIAGLLVEAVGQRLIDNINNGFGLEAAIDKSGFGKAFNKKITEIENLILDKIDSW